MSGITGSKIDIKFFPLTGILTESFCSSKVGGASSCCVGVELPTGGDQRRGGGGEREGGRHDRDQFFWVDISKIWKVYRTRQIKQCKTLGEDNANWENVFG